MTQPERNAAPRSPDRAHPWVWLLAIVFGAGGAGTVWFNEKNQIDRLTDQLVDARSQATDLRTQFAAAKAEAERRATDISVERSLRTECERARAQEQAEGEHRCGNVVGAGSMGVAQGGSSVRIER